MDVIVARPAVGPLVRIRNDLGTAPCPLFALLAGGWLPLILPSSLLRTLELSRLLPLLGAPCLEVPTACPDPLLLVTARLALAVRAGVRGLPLLRTGYARVLVVVCPPPPPSGEADDDRSSTLDALDIDRDDSFRSVLAFIRNFHGMEEPAGVPSAHCKTSLASIYVFMLETSPTFHLGYGRFLMSRI